jgi:hypothetical protein
MLRRLGLRKRPDVPLTCPYCHGPTAALEPVWACPRCKTLHHAGCAAENGHCTILGCEAPFVAAANSPEPRRSRATRNLIVLGLLLLASLTPFLASKLTHKSRAAAPAPPAVVLPEGEPRDFSPEIAGAMDGEVRFRAFLGQWRDKQILVDVSPRESMKTARSLFEATRESDRPALEARVRQLLAAKLAHTPVSPAPTKEEVESVVGLVFSPTRR